MRCPACGGVMERRRRGDAWFFRCDPCGSHALTIPTLRKMVPQAVWSVVWLPIRDSSAPGRHECPSCRRRMEETPRLEPAGASLDFCDPCDLLYLDPKEFDRLPKVPVKETPQLPPEVARALAMAEVELINLEYDAKLLPLLDPLRRYFLAVIGRLGSM